MNLFARLVRSGRRIPTTVEAAGKLCSSPIFPASIPRMYADKHTWQPDRAVLPPPNFKRFSTTAESSGTAGQYSFHPQHEVVRVLIQSHPL